MKYNNVAVEAMKILLKNVEYNEVDSKEIRKNKAAWIAHLSYEIADAMLDKSRS